MRLLVLSLLLHTFAAFGFAFVVGFSKILSPLRQLVAPDYLRFLEALQRQTSRTKEELANVVELAPLIRAIKERDRALGQRSEVTQLAGPLAAREWILTLLTCPPCLGWWYGLISGFGFTALLAAPGYASQWYFHVGVALALAFYTSATNLILGRLTGLIPAPA